MAARACVGNLATHAVQAGQKGPQGCRFADSHLAGEQTHPAFPNERVQFLVEFFELGVDQQLIRGQCLGEDWGRQSMEVSVISHGLSSSVPRERRLDRSEYAESSPSRRRL